MSKQQQQYFATNAQVYFNYSILCHKHISYTPNLQTQTLCHMQGGTFPAAKKQGSLKLLPNTSELYGTKVTLVRQVTINSAYNHKWVKQVMCLKSQTTSYLFSSMHIIDNIGLFVVQKFTY